VLIAMLVCAYFLRLFCLTVLEPRMACWRKLPWWARRGLQYYIVVYAVLACVVLDILLMAVSTLYSNPWLDPGNFNSSEHEPIPSWFCYLSLGAPLAATATFVIGIAHTHVHANAIDKYSGGMLSKSVQRDRTIQVIALPSVYSIMSACCVLQLWALFSGHHASGLFFADGKQLDVGTTYEERDGFALQRCTAFFAIADLYEAYALLQFVHLSLMEIDTSVRMAQSEGEPNIPRSLHMTEGREKHGEACPWCNDNETESSEDEEQVRELPNDDLSHLLAALESLTMQGVLWFVFSAFLSSIYNLVAVHFAQHRDGLKLPLWLEGCEKYLDGIGFITSSAAITNVVSVERSLHHFFADFRATPKFLSIKIMVSIAFIQSIALYLLSDQLPASQRKLLYATLICYETLGLACLHLYAWPSDEPWLQNTEAGRRAARLNWYSLAGMSSINKKMLRWAQRAKAKVAARKRMRYQSVCSAPPLRGNAETISSFTSRESLGQASNHDDYRRFAGARDKRRAITQPPVVSQPASRRMGAANRDYDHTCRRALSNNADLCNKHVDIVHERGHQMMAGTSR